MADRGALRVTARPSSRSGGGADRRGQGSEGSGSSRSSSARPGSGSSRSSSARPGAPRSGAPRSGSAPTGAPRPGAPKRSDESRTRRDGEPGRGPQRRSTGRPAGQGPPRGSAGRGAGPTGRPAARDDEQPLPGQARKWGNVARRGAREVTRRDDDVEASESRSPSASPRGARYADDQERERRRGTPRPSRPAAWVRDDGARDEWEDTAATRSRGRQGASKSSATRASASASEAIAALSPRHTLPPEIAAEIRKAADVATVRHREGLVERAQSAYGAYERGRYQDALRAIKPVAEEAPGVAAVRELAGLAAYRCGKWREAARHLVAYGTLSDSTEHLPVLMDCQRALAQAQEGGRVVERAAAQFTRPRCPRRGQDRRRRDPGRDRRSQRRHLNADDGRRLEGPAEPLGPPPPAVVPPGGPVRARR